MTSRSVTDDSKTEICCDTCSNCYHDSGFVVLAIIAGIVLVVLVCSICFCCLCRRSTLPFVTARNNAAQHRNLTRLNIEDHAPPRYEVVTKTDEHIPPPPYVPQTHYGTTKESQ